MKTWLAVLITVFLAGEGLMAETRTLVLGGGCFWCVEAVYEQLPGVTAVESGYAGGASERPSYEEVSSGRSGHAEVVKITYDPARVNLETLLDWFWKSHDPTTLNRQGADVGTQYRSVLYYEGEAERQAVAASRARAQAELSAPIVTEVAPRPVFWPAEAYHQDYYARNPWQGYCRVVIRPKLLKLGLQP